jgi:protein gp37
MNTTKIEWCDKTINPVVGCTHGCPYCYARKMAQRQGKTSCCYDFKPHPHLERLEQMNEYQKPYKIFIDSMWDWNCKDNDIVWLNAILKKMSECKQHIFQILTKMPNGYSRFKFPPNAWLGTTVTTNADLKKIDQLVAAANGNLKFVSVEPIHSKIDHNFSGIDWIIIGGETGNRKGKILPQEAWIADIISKAAINKIPVFIKDNAKWPQEIKQFPSR